MAKKKTVKSNKKNDIVIVRTIGAGVHVGEIVSQRAQTVTLENAVRVWRWRGANTLYELSKYGADHGYTRISEAVESVFLTTVVEIIPCTPKAAANLQESRWGE